MLPTMNIGDLKVSRLIVGSNPFTGKSHLDRETDADMLDHYTEERIFSMLERCEAVGINAVQSRGSMPVMGLLKKYRDLGGNLLWLAQTGKDLSTFSEELDEMMKYKPSAICIHGELSDFLYLNGMLDRLEGLLEQMRRKNLPVGICSHFPEVLIYAEEHGICPDYYMASVFNLFLPDPKRGESTPGERFDISDVPRMYEVIRSLSAPTVALKILGAGRRCADQNEVKNAFIEAFSSMKVGDGVLVGMFDKYVDQVRLNAEYTAEAIRLAESKR
ncbi:MAG: hypothetical protein E7643_02045 [Ruminococcaceae bacterium]|nr:hypothetical protein [Oscillospiraceae bacterium]